MKVFIVVQTDRENHYLDIAGVYFTEKAAEQSSSPLWRTTIVSKNIEDVCVSPAQKLLESLAKANEWRKTHSVGD